MNLREIYENNSNTTIYDREGDVIGSLMDVDEFEQAIADYEKSKWVSGDEFPDLLTHQGCSRNVIAEVEGCKELLVMCAFFLKEDDGHIVWARVYDGLNGDGEHDDNYNVIRWTEIPTLPTI